MRVVVSCGLAALALAACDGMRFEFMNLERPSTDIGLRPPADFAPCYQGRAEGLGTDKNGKPDVVRVKDEEGHEICHGNDTNHDGRIHEWGGMGQDGNLRKPARATNGDAVADEAWT